MPSSPNFRLSNFLSDKATQPYMAMIDLCAAFGVGQSTAGGKARVVSAALHTHRVAVAEHCRPGVDGGGQRPSSRLAREPREVQEIAFAKGLIPYIPADRGVGWEVAPGLPMLPRRRSGFTGRTAAADPRRLTAAVTPADEGK